MDVTLFCTQTFFLFFSTSTRAKQAREKEKERTTIFSFFSPTSPPPPLALGVNKSPGDIISYARSTISDSCKTAFGACLIDPILKYD